MAAVLFRTVLFLFFFTHLYALKEIGVTYEFSHGRFGDNLFAYLHAKWVAYQKNLPLFYKPFPLSSQLVMHEKEPRFSPFSDEPRYLHNLVRGPIPRFINSSVLYVCPYFPEDRWERETTMDMYGPWFSLDVEWEDPNFRKLALEMVAPIKKLALITPPREFISIALHVREGGGFDTPYAFEKGSTIHPHKMPPLHFYLDGFRKAFELFPGKDFYCYVFTDAENPETIVRKLKQSIPQEMPIIFDYRKKGNHHTANVVEDFFSLFNFDVLIRSQSNFSLAAARLHDFALDYSPGRFVIQGDQVQILDAEMRVRERYEL